MYNQSIVGDFYWNGSFLGTIESNGDLIWPNGVYVGNVNLNTLEVTRFDGQYVGKYSEQLIAQLFLPPNLPR